jgi:hypothetical protein
MMAVLASASIIDRLLPRQSDNRPGGYRAALRLLGFLIALKLVISLNSIFNTAKSTTAGWFVNIGQLALLTFGLVLSLVSARAGHLPQTEV